MCPWPQTGQGWPTNGSGDDAAAGAVGVEDAGADDDETGAEEAVAADALEEAGAALSVCFFAAGFLRVAVDFAAAVLLAGRIFRSSSVVMVT